MQSTYSLKDVAKVCGVQPHRISYAISNGFLPEPLQRITNRRIFTDGDVKLAKTYFAKPSDGGRSKARREDNE